MIQRKMKEARPLSSQDSKKKMITIVLPERLAIAFKAAAAKEDKYMQDLAAEVFEDYLMKKHNYKRKDVQNE